MRTMTMIFGVYDLLKN